MVFLKNSFSQSRARYAQPHRQTHSSPPSSHHPRLDAVAPSGKRTPGTAAESSPMPKTHGADDERVGGRRRPWKTHPRPAPSAPMENAPVAPVEAAAAAPAGFGGGAAKRPGKRHRMRPPGATRPPLVASLRSYLCTPRDRIRRRRRLMKLLWDVHRRAHHLHQPCMKGGKAGGAAKTIPNTGRRPERRHKITFSLSPSRQHVDYSLGYPHRERARILQLRRHQAHIV